MRLSREHALEKRMLACKLTVLFQQAAGLFEQFHRGEFLEAAAFTKAAARTPPGLMQFFPV